MLLYVTIVIVDSILGCLHIMNELSSQRADSDREDLPQVNK